MDDKKYEQGALEVFMEALVTGNTSAAIENQEKRGQDQLTYSSKLPIKINGGTRDQFEAMGIIYHEPVDDLFVAVTLPEGWKVKPTDHSMWSDLVDQLGRIRANIFYKAAFYDRSAHMHISRRFRPGYMPVGGWESSDNRGDISECVGVVYDGEKVIWQSEPATKDRINDPKWYDVDDKLHALSVVWLKEHYPDWENPLAYWDVPENADS